MNSNSTQKEITIVESKSDILLKDMITAPLKMLAVLSAISGVLALVFEVQTLVIHSFEVYISRLAATVVAFVVLVVAETKFVKKKPEFLVHIMVLAVIISSGFVVYRLPEMFQINSNFIALYIFMIGLARGWKYKHQIFVVIYFSIIYSTAIIANPVLSNNNRMMIETTSIVLVLCIMSIIASIVSYKSREKIFKNHLSKPSENPGITDKIKSDKLFKNLVEYSAVGFYQFDSTGIILYVNKAAAKILGYKNVNELIGKNAYELIFSNSSSRKSLEKILSENKIIKNYKIKLKKKGGSGIIAKINERLIYEGEEKRKIYEGNIQDITQQIKIENSRKKELELIKTESSQAKYQASSAVYNSKVKSQFLAKMSHEIRTPLNSVLGFLTLIENGLFESEEELKDFAHNARVSSDSLLDTINNVLDLSKIEAGKMELNEDEFSIREEIDKAISIIKTVAKEKNLEVYSTVGPEVPPSVIGDSTRYRQVIVNLLSNASKYTRSGSISVEVEIIKTTAATVKVLTTVKDTGIGIKKEKISQLFKPYTQLSSDKQTNHQGTGLGLIICKDFVGLMGGKINVESEEGNGTTVKFTVIVGLEKDFLKSKDYEEMKETDSGFDNKNVLELTQENQNNSLGSANKNSKVEVSQVDNSKTFDADKNVQNSDRLDPKPLIEPFNSASHAFPRTTLRQKRLLLVEDNPISQRIELKLLRETGYSVDPVSNAFDAIAAIKSNAFDLVLMDIEMDEMNGIEATQKIRALDPPINKIPIIAVTAHSSMKDRERCLAAGMDDYIAKPINIHFLKMTIDQWLKNDRG